MASIGLGLGTGKCSPSYSLINIESTSNSSESFEFGLRFFCIRSYARANAFSYCRSFFIGLNISYLFCVYFVILFMSAEPYYKYNFQAIFDIYYQSIAIPVNIENYPLVRQNGGVAILSL